MLLQRTFKKNYVEALLDAVRNGQNLDLYAQDSFDYDAEQVVMIPNLAYPEGLIDKLVPTPQGDFDSAVAIYEAFPNLTPLQAADKSFWTYLTHVDLFEYVQKRYPKVKDEGFNSIPYIVDHWFCGSDWYWRHPIASLWWFVHQTIDENNGDKYKYTRFFFSSFGFRTNFAKYSIARLKEAVFGYFDFLMENPEITAQFLKPRNLFITKHLNKMGGARLLSVLPREAFKEELYNIKDQILAVSGVSTRAQEEAEDAAMFE